MEFKGNVSAGRDVNIANKNLRVTNSSDPELAALEERLAVARRRFEQDGDDGTFRTELRGILKLAKEFGQASAPIVATIGGILAVL